MGFLVHKGFGWGDVGENNLARFYETAWKVSQLVLE